MKRILSFALGAALFAGLAFGQNRTRFAGLYNALDYAYGQVPNVAPLVVDIGNTSTTGSTTLTLSFGNITLGDGTRVMPLSTLAPITAGSGTNAETVTPTAVSCSTPGTLDTCTITATFANLHGTGDQITSSTWGLDEAIIAAQGSGGGQVLISGAWGTDGGTNAMITAAPVFSAVTLQDTRSGVQYWNVQPNTLSTGISAPAVLTSSTVTFTAAPVGTWGTSAYYICISYVDALGGQSPCSASYTQTPGTANYSLNIVSPAAATGAVGWRAYAGITSTALAYRLPITSANCTLTTLESVTQACAIGSNGVWPTLYVSTTALSPSPIIQVTNKNNPVFQSHTTFAYQPTGSLPSPFQTAYGPFGTALTATAGDVTVLGSFDLPLGFLNTIGRTIRITGIITGSNTATGYLKLYGAISWTGGATAGLPVSVTTLVNTAGTSTGTAAFNDSFSMTLQTQAVGTTAVGSIQANSWQCMEQATYASLCTSDMATAATGSLGLFAQDTFYIYINPTAESPTVVQLLALNIEVLQ